MINKILKSTAETIPLGTVVIVRSGREKGGFYIVVGNESDKDRNYAMIADGKKRKIMTPKKKNIKHLSKTKTVISFKELTDKQLRIILSRFIKEYGERV